LGCFEEVVRGFGIEVMMDGMATVFVWGWDCFFVVWDNNDDDDDDSA
jgi:hypothetical protein